MGRNTLKDSVKDFTKNFFRDFMVLGTQYAIGDPMFMHLLKHVYSPVRASNLRVSNAIGDNVIKFIKTEV